MYVADCDTRVVPIVVTATVWLSDLMLVYPSNLSI